MLPVAGETIIQPIESRAVPPPSNRSVLIVEDDMDSRSGLAAILALEGYDVAEAEHGAQALAMLRARPAVCVILLDLWMPTMNGITFRQRQLADPALAEIPVVVLSADPTAMQAIRALGVRETLIKPVDVDRLLRIVDAHCGP